MNIEDLKTQLRAEGFTHTYVWEDGPGVFYPDHPHPHETAHVVLDGEVTVTSEGKTLSYKAGERFDVPARTIHSAKMGPKGCRYLMGEKWPESERDGWAAGFSLLFPLFPVLHRNFEHRLDGAVQPVWPAFLQVAGDREPGLLTAQVHIGGLEAHGP